MQQDKNEWQRSTRSKNKTNKQNTGKKKLNQSIDNNPINS